MLYPVELRALYLARLFRAILSGFSGGRGGGIRTHDPLLPKQMRYQAALRPEEARILQTDTGKVK